jgi:hypothetical protein
MPKNRSVKKNVQRRGSKHATRKASSLKSGILRRDTRQDDQERKSRAQFCEVFSDWIPADISPDKGEDLLVRIYEDRRWTALTFFAQLKSTQHLDRETQTEDAISLSLDTKDFPHWIDANPPVIVVFWDVNKRTGVWQDFPRIMSEVSASTPGWRKQKTVTAHIPKKNTTDEKGRRLLRQRIATLTYPVISKGRTMEVKFSTQFPPTDDGRAQHLGLVRALEDGLPLVIPPENVTALSFPDWHERAFGKVTGKVQLEISPAKREKEPELALLSSAAQPTGSSRRLSCSAEQEAALFDRSGTTPTVMTRLWSSSQWRIERGAGRARARRISGCRPRSVQRSPGSQLSRTWPSCGS